MSHESPLLNLPNDIVTFLLHFLDMEDIFALNNTSRALRTKYLTPDFWKAKLRELLTPKEDIETIMKRLVTYYQDSTIGSNFHLAVRKLYPFRKGILSKYAKYHRVFLTSVRTCIPTTLYRLYSDFYAIEPRLHANFWGDNVLLILENLLNSSWGPTNEYAGCLQFDLRIGKEIEYTKEKGESNSSYGTAKFEIQIDILIIFVTSISSHENLTYFGLY